MLRQRVMLMWAVCTIAAAVFAARADAAIQMVLQANDQTETFFADALTPNDLSVTWTSPEVVAGDGSAVRFNVAVGMSNSPGGPFLSIVRGDGQTIEGTLLADKTASIYVTATDFTFPTTPPPVAVETAATGLNFQGALTTFSVTSYVDGTQTGTASGSNRLGSLALGDQSILTDLSQPFPVSLLLAVDRGTGGGEIDLNIDGSVILTHVPEPGTLAIWSVLVGGAALTAARKRRGRWTKSNRQAIMGIIVKK